MDSDALLIVTPVCVSTARESRDAINWWSVECAYLFVYSKQNN